MAITPDTQVSGCLKDMSSKEDKRLIDDVLRMLCRL